MMRNAPAVQTAVAQLLPFFAKAVTSIMRYTGLLVAVLFLILLCFFQYPRLLYQGVFNDLSLDISGDMFPVINYVGFTSAAFALNA